MSDNNLLNTCSLCGKKYIGCGNSTWGYWQTKGYNLEEDSVTGEMLRCCDDCNVRIIIPSRLKIVKQKHED